MENNCPNPNLVQAFPYVKNDGLKLRDLNTTCEFESKKDCM